MCSETFQWILKFLRILLKSYPLFLPGFWPVTATVDHPPVLPECDGVPLPCPQVPHLLPGPSKLHTVPIQTTLLPALCSSCECSGHLLFLQVTSFLSQKVLRLSFTAATKTSSVHSTVRSVPLTPSVVPAAASRLLAVLRTVPAVLLRLRISQVSIVIIL